MAAVDPNIQAILDQHQQHLALLDQNQRQQRIAQERRYDNYVKDKYITEQKEKVGICDGQNLKAVRDWSRNITASVNRVPAGQNVNDYVIDLMKATAVGDLLEEIENFIFANDGAALTHNDIRDYINVAFLGPDEANVLKDKLKEIKQSAREEIPAYNRRFVRNADYAYPNPRDQADDRMLSELYIVSLANTKIRDKLFAHDPAIVTLNGAVQFAAEEWARTQR